MLVITVGHHPQDMFKSRTVRVLVSYMSVGRVV